MFKVALGSTVQMLAYITAVVWAPNPTLAGREQCLSLASRGSGFASTFPPLPRPILGL